MNDENNNYKNNEEESTSSTLSVGRGCRFRSTPDGMEAMACPSSYKLNSENWLADYPANMPDDIVEVRFKHTHRGYYRNVNNLPLKEGDIVAVEASPGHDIGIVSMTGDLVARQMRRVGFNPQNGEFRKIYRKAKSYDIERWQEAIALEHDTMIRAREIAAEMNLNMKIGDVEYQGDKIKAIFYYIADERVDFRELIKVFAEQFHIRVEMKQIGARQEAGRIGGLGSCGRQLCCASWMSSFVSVTTGAARTQDLSLNPQKLAGQCSKLKCCLVYELDSYIDARKDFPRLNGPLQTLDADYYHVKSDILGHTMSFSTDPHSLVGMKTISVRRVREIMRLNAEGKKPEQLLAEHSASNIIEEPEFVNVIGEDSISRFDNKRRKKKRGGRNQNQRQGGQQRTARGQGSAEEQRKGDQAEQHEATQQRSKQHDERGCGRGEGRKGSEEGRQQRQGGEGGRQHNENRGHNEPRNHRKHRPAGDQQGEQKPRSSESGTQEQKAGANHNGGGQNSANHNNHNGGHNRGRSHSRSDHRGGREQREQKPKSE